MSHAYYSLYCKQSELEQPWEFPWACGFASLVTCFRILGDRTTENDELIARFKETGQHPHEGMTSDEAVDLAQSLGYRAVKNPSSARDDKDAFVRWMQSKWRHGNPIMLSVDSGNAQGESDHWWTVYGDPDERNVWVMDPLQDAQPFQCLSISEVMSFASCNDGEGYLEYDGVAIASTPDADMTAIPPSAALMNFLNENTRFETGWTAHAIAAALVDNHFSSVEGVNSQGNAGGARAVVLSDLLLSTGPVAEVIDEWDVFFSDVQRTNIEALLGVLYDVEVHLDHRIAASETDHLIREIVLNLILIGTNLMGDISS